MPIIPIPEGLRRVARDSFDESEAERYRAEADAKLKRLQDTPMAQLSPDEPLKGDFKRPAWMGSRGYDTPDFTSSAEPTIVPAEGDESRDLSELGLSPRFSEELSQPVAPESDVPGVGFGSGGPEGGALSEATILDIRKRLADKQASTTADKDMRSRLLQGVNPDEAASAIDLAAKSGVNRLQVEVNPETYKRADTMRQIDELRTSAPKLRAWLDYNPENLDVAHDDVETLSWWDQAGKTAGEIGAGIPGALGSGYLKISEGAYGVLRAPFEINDQFVSWVTGKKQVSDPAKFFAGMQAEAKAQSDGLMPETEDATARGVLSGFQSIPASAMAAIVGVMSGGAAPALGLMGGVTGGSEYGRARAQGMSPSSALGYGTGQGLIEVATEALPMTWLIGDAAKRTPFFQMLTKQALGEGVTEQVATHSQDFLSWAVLPENEGKPISAFLEERGPAAYETLLAALVGSGIQTTIAKGADETLRMVDEGHQQRRTEYLAKTFEAMKGNADASKLLKRLPQKYRDFANGVTKDGPLESVRVQPEAFNELAQSAGVTTEQLAQAFRIDPADIVSAIESGEDVVIPSGNYAAALSTAKKEIGISGEQIHAAFAPNMRLRAEDFTAKEREAMKAVYEEEKAAREKERAHAAEPLTLQTLPQQLLMLARDARAGTVSKTGISQAEREMLEEAGYKPDEDGNYDLNDLIAEADKRKAAGKLNLSMSQYDNSHIVEWEAKRNGRTAGQTFADAADRVREAVRTQLADAKIFNNETASTQAQIASEMIITLAERTGQDPETLWNEVGFKVTAQVGEDVSELSQSQTRPAEPVSDEELTRASAALQPREFEAWKLGREGRSAEDIAVAIGGENAEVTPQTVLAWQTAARRKGFALARIHEPTNPKGRPQTPETQRVIEMLAAGQSRDEIITEVYPDRDPGKARNLVRQLNHKHKVEIEAKRAPVMELAQSSLDMSEPARMQRAREQGFDVDTPLYHGTTEAFEEFDPAKTGSKFGYDKKGFFFSDDPKTARSYSYTPDEKRDSWARFSADGKAMADARTVKTYVRLKDPITLEELAAHPEYKRAPYEDPTDIYDNNRALIEKISEGRDGVDLRFRGQRLVNVFDPANIRRTDAAFDPSQSESSKLLAQDKRGGFTGINLSQDPVIRLYESANLSTFSHEAAHWYLTTLEKLARTEAPHPFVVAQLAAVREWAGKSAEFQIYDDSGQITPEGVELQEAFSETFEAYLREGKAPSTALRQVFATMKAWLLRTYKQVRDRFFQRDAKGNWVPALGRVRVTEADGFQISQEIRDVFDRMLATEEAIAAARTGMEQDADRMAKALLDKGVITEKAYARTRERLQAAREKAEADLMSRLMEEYERSQKSWYRDEERQVRRDVTSEIDERPEQRAFAWLSGKGWRDTQADHVQRAAEAEFMQAVDEGLFETDANDDTLKLLQQRAIERGLGPLILMFRTTSGRIIAFPGENGAVYHDLARNLFGLGDLKLEHGMYNPRKWPTLADMDAAGDRAWYATTGEHADTEARELAQRTYQHDKHREQVKTAYDYLRDNPEAVSGPLSKIMAAVDVSAFAADRARRLVRRGELAQLDGPVIVYRGSEENGVSSAGVGRLGTGVYLAEDPEIGGEWGGQTGKVDAYRINGRLFDLDETTAEGLENYEKQEDTEAAKKLFTRLKSEGYVGVRDPWSGHINVFVDGAMERYADADVELGATWTNEAPELGQMGGERSFLFPHDQKQRAFDMEQSGVSEAEIWRETGLARGADGAWRHEIDDSKATFLPKLDEVDALGDEGVPLDQVLRHKVLFDAYPQLKKITVSFQPSDSKDGGYWQVFGRHIAISRASKSQMLSVLLHELQHAIQDIERFASGGSFNQPRMENPEWTAFQKQVQEDAELRAFLEQRRRLSRRIAAAERIAKPVQDQAIQLAIQKIYEVDLSEVEKIDERIYALYAPVKAVLQSKYPDVQDLWRDEAKLRDSGKLPPVVPDRYISGMDVYYALAGEVEARNVQSRAKMTVEERAEKAPSETEWPKRARQIVQFKGFGFSLSQTGGNARTTPPLALPPMRLDLAAVKEQYGDEALAAIPPEVRAYSAQATDADQFAEVARDVRKTLAKKRPKSLWKFLSTSRTIGGGNDKISYRGIRDDGGELIKIIGEKKAAPGLIADGEDAKKVRSYTIEHAANVAWEDGYFNGPNPPTPAEFLDALRSDFDGQAPLYARADMETVSQIKAAEQWEQWFDQNGIDISESAETLRPKLETLLTSEQEGAIGPDEAAPFFKMPDGNALLQGLKEGPKRNELIRKETQRRMIERHGDPFKDGTIMREAETFARNEVQQRQDEIELEALGRAAGRQFETNLAKQMARENLKTKQLREILNYNQWLTLEGRWNKKAIEAATKGDTDKAFDYKRYALINRQMFLEGRKLAEKIEKDITFLRTFEKKEKRAKLLKAGQDFLDQMDQLLEQIDLRKRSPKDLRERQTLAAWFAEKQTQADPLRNTVGMTPEEVMAAQIEEVERSSAIAAMQQEAQLRNYQSLTVEEFSAVRDQADMIVNMARLVGGLLEDGERRSLQLAVDDIVARAVAAKPKVLPPESYASFSPKEAGKRGRREYLAELRTMQALVRMIDGVDNGPLAKNTLQKLNPAYSRRIARTREEEERIVELYRKAFGDKLADLRKGQMRFPGVEVALSRLERISVALNMGTEINRKRLMDGYGWDAGTLQSIIDTLNQEDWAFVSSMWDYINSLYPEANKAHLDAHGVPLSKQDGVPVVTRFGIIQGQYFPLKYDPHRSSRAEQKALDAEAKQVAGRVGTRKASGFTKERVKGRVTMPVLLDFTVVVPRHVDEVVASITTQKALLDVGRIITHKDVEQVIVERHGRTVYKQLLSALREARNGQETARLAAERALIRLRNGATIVGLGWNLKTALLQMGGHTNSVVRLGGPNLGAIGGLPWLLKGIYRMGVGAQGMQNGLKFIVQRSEYMRNRRESQNREMADLRRKLEGGSVKGAAQSFIEQSSMFLIVRAQYYLVDGPLWLGAYEKAVGSGASEADAVASADQTVIDAQGGGEVYQLAGIQRGSPLLKLFTNFLSYSVTTWNLNVNRTRATNFRNPGQAAAWALDMAILNWAPVLLTILAASVMATGGGDDEDDLQEQMVRQQLSFLMSQLGLFGQMGSAINEFSYSGPQGTRAFSDASKAVQAAGKDIERLLAGEDMTGDVIRPLNLALGAWFHYPAGALDRFVRGAWAMADGETNDPKALVSGPPRN